MRLPIRHVAGNLIWTTQGAVWAVWRVEAENFSHASRSAKVERLAALESLFKSLRDHEALLLSLCPRVDPVVVVGNMVRGVDLDASPEYARMSQQVLESLAGVDLTGRVDWLAVPLPSVGGWRERAGQLLGAGGAHIGALLGLAPVPVGRDELMERLRQAQALQEGLPAQVGLRAATEAEILWVYAHAARRGLIEPDLPDPTAPRLLRGAGHGTAALAEVWLDEGGRSDPAPKGRRRDLSPFRHRYVKVSTEFGDSYQTFLSLAEMPDAFRFPGGEWLAALDEFAFPVDWAVRLDVSSGAKAEAKSRRQARELAYQRTQYDEDTAGAPASLDEAGLALDDYRARLTANSTEVELQAKVVLCVWSSDRREMERRAHALVNHYGGNDYTFVRPVGGQVPLFHAMLPGCPVPQVMNDYTQFLLAKDFAMGMPFSGTAIGDDTGTLYGLTLNGGGVRPVLVDFSLGPRVDASASGAFIGELGSGKSVAMKTAMYAVLARGRRDDLPGSRGRAVVVDRTTQREWERFAAACPGTTQVIRVDEHASVSLDPLRIFAGAGQQRVARTARATESFLTLLLGTASMSTEGITLSEAVAETLTRPRPSLNTLTAVLEERPDAEARELARKLKAISRKDLSRVLFDESLPPVAAGDADTVVFATAGLQLPKREELTSEYRIQRLEFEKVLGRALLYLIAALCHQIAFDDPNEFTAVFWDECWWLTSSPEGQALVLELIRDGRKHNAAAYLGSHDPADVGLGEDSEVGETIRGLLSHRYLFRHRNARLAARGLDFLGLDPTDPDLLKTVTEQLSPLAVAAADREARAGECLYRDLRARVAPIKVVIPPDPAIYDAIQSTPTALSRAAQ